MNQPASEFLGGLAEAGEDEQPVGRAMKVARAIAAKNTALASQLGKLQEGQIAAQ